MKLNYRYTSAYALVTLVVLAIGFAIVYAAFSRSSTQATIGKLEHLNDVVAARLRSRPLAPGLPLLARVQIDSVRQAEVRPGQMVRVGNEWDESLQTPVAMVRLTTYVVARGQAYRLRSHAAVVEPKDIYFTGLMMVFAWTFVFLMALVVILSEAISWRILQPFNATLRSIQVFQLGQKEGLILPPSNTAEFNQLNDFVGKMATQAQRDYQALREFSENASHELQTPLASIKAQIELLMDSNLAEAQLLRLTAMHDELERLAKINQALTLLAKLEHYESQPGTTTDLSQLVLATQATFADLAEMKKIQTVQNVAPNVHVPLDAALAQLLLNNVFSNAIRHNLPGGQLHLTLSDAELVLRNTGHAPSAPVSELFGRFKRGNASLDSIGIGLAIVKRISELYGHQISYAYADGWHSVMLRFTKPA